MTPPAPATFGPVVLSKVRPPRVRWLPRERLDQRLDALWRDRLTLVVAPAGSGKTTVLAGWAATASARGLPVAWYRAEGTDGDPTRLLGHLWAAVGLARDPDGLRPRDDQWPTVEAAVAAIDRAGEAPLLLVVDDLHTLAGSPAEATLERLLDYAGPGLAAAVGTRTTPDFNLSRRRVSGELAELGGDELRFRSWEVEQLFREFYGDALQSDELTRLARRTEGWAAGLQLFHLATLGKTPGERARLLDGSGSGSRLLREYLARNVVDELPDGLRAFLVATCVLRRLSGPLCDRLLDTAGSERLLEELERRQVFTVALDGIGTYRYHEVLRSHLEGLLVEDRGEAAARAWSARAGGLLEAEGAVAEALAAYCRAEDWDAAARVLGSRGAVLATTGAADGGSWLDALPAAILRHDPWVMLATARRLRAEGQWLAAVEAFGAAEAAFGGADAAVGCRDERLALAAFVDPMARPGRDWAGLLRVTVGRPAPARDAGAGWDLDAGRRLAAAVGLLIAGQPRQLLAHLATANPEGLDRPGDAPAEAAALALVAGVAAALAGRPAMTAIDTAIGQAEVAGQVWLARLGRAALALVRPEALGAAAALRVAAGRAGDRWGEALAALIESWARLAPAQAGPVDLERAQELAEVAAGASRAVGSAALEAWSRALGAFAAARLNLADAREAVLQAEAMARAAGVPGAGSVIYRALAMVDAEHAPDHLALARSAEAEYGLRAPGEDTPEAQDPRPSAEGAGMASNATASPNGAGGAPLDVRLLGGFAIAVGGRPLDLHGLKPRPRAILRLLALHAGRPIHREVLAATFWPDADPTIAARNLHVALSSLRRELEAGSPGASALVARDGDAYRLAVPPDGHVDVIDVEDAVARGRAARRRGDHVGAIEALTDAVTRGGAELLPEDGPAEWVVGRREEVRAAVADAARLLAELLMADDPGRAAEMCTAGLRVDPYYDPLWRLLADARERAGDPAAAVTARHAYGRVLARLGVEVADEADGAFAAELAAAVLATAGGPVSASSGTRSP